MVEVLIFARVESPHIEENASKRFYGVRVLHSDMLWQSPPLSYNTKSARSISVGDTDIAALLQESLSRKSERGQQK